MFVSFHDSSLSPLRIRIEFQLSPPSAVETYISFSLPSILKSQHTKKSCCSSFGAVAAMGACQMGSLSCLKNVGENLKGRFLSPVLVQSQSCCTRLTQEHSTMFVLDNCNSVTQLCGHFSFAGFASQFFSEVRKNILIQMN